MTLSRLRHLMLASALLVMAGLPANAADDFYKGKTIKLVVGSAPGAGYDAYGRLIARHLGKYLPGQPNVLVTYMPGADGIIAGNYMANLAERDGTVFGTFNRYIVTKPLLGNANAKFKANEFNWIGTTTSYADDSYVLIVRSGVPHRNIDDLRDPQPTPELRDHRQRPQPLFQHPDHRDLRPRPLTPPPRP